MSDAPDSVVAVLREHRIECSSKATGEVTCRACRERSWMPLGEFTQHVADAAWVASLDAAAERLEGSLTGRSILPAQVACGLLRRWAGEQERGEG